MPMGVPHYTKSIHQHKPLTFSLRACIYFLKYLNLYHFFNICYHGKKTQSIAAWIKLDNSPGKRNDEKGNLLQAKVFLDINQFIAGISDQYVLYDQRKICQQY